MGHINTTATVIIPVYNSEKFVERCLQSILNQTEKDVQIITIDDGSTDRSREILESYAASHKNIATARTHERLLAGGARNLGLKLAEGKYVSFVDSDDWIDTNFLSSMVSELEASGSDIAVCNVKREYKTSCESAVRYQYARKNNVSGKFALRTLCRTLAQDIAIGATVTNKLFRSSFLSQKNLRFLPNSVNEDDVFTFKAFSEATSVSIVDNVSYHQLQRQHSVSRDFSSKHIVDLFDAFSEIREYLNRAGTFETHKEDYFSFFEKCLSYLFETIQRCKMDENEVQKHVVDIIINMNRLGSPKEILEYVGYNRILGFFPKY